MSQESQSTVPKAAQLIMMSLAYVQGQALRAAAELQVADLLAEGPRSTAQLAAKLKAHEPSLYRLLRTLASVGIFEEIEPRLFAMTPLAQPLRSRAPDSVRAAMLWVGSPMHYGACEDLASCVRSGQPSFDARFGDRYFDYLQKHPVEARVWDEGMAVFSSLENAPIAMACPLPKDARVVDVGGGQGGFLVELLKADPTRRGILFDKAYVVASPRAIEHASLLGRCEIVAGDFFEAVPRGADVYVYKRVLHDWDDETCVKLLRCARTAMPAHARLLVVDAVLPAGNAPHPAKLVDLVMMAALNGVERTEGELAALLDRAGFKLQRVIPTHSMLSVVEASPA